MNIRVAAQDAKRANNPSRSPRSNGSTSSYQEAQNQHGGEEEVLTFNFLNIDAPLRSSDFEIQQYSNSEEMLTANIPFEAHLSLYEKQEMEMMDELLSMDFDENTDFEPMNNIEATFRGTFYLRLFIGVSS